MKGSREMKKSKPLAEGMTRKGGRNQGASQIKRRPAPPKRLLNVVDCLEETGNVTIKDAHFLRDAIKDAQPKIRRAFNEAMTGRLSSIPPDQQCPRCGHIFYGFDIREPSAGFYWVRRDDGKKLLVKVHDDRGRKSVSFFGDDRNRQGLKHIRENFSFIQRVEPPQ